jgi:hypothetical protein
MMLRDAMIVWTPNRGIWRDRPTAGQIAVTTIPEHPRLKEHPMSTGACDHNWRETDDAGRRELLQRYFTKIIHDDGIGEDAARQVLSVIEDINPAHLSADKPEPEDDDDDDDE